MDETTVLNLDDTAMYRDLPDRLNALAPDRFLAVYTSCLADLRDQDLHRYDSDRLDLIDRTIDLAAGGDPPSVLTDWYRLTGFVEDPDEDTPDTVGDEIDSLENACIALAYQLARDETPPTAARALADAALGAIDDPGFHR